MENVGKFGKLLGNFISYCSSDYCEKIENIYLKHSFHTSAELRHFTIQQLI